MIGDNYVESTFQKLANNQVWQLEIRFIMHMTVQSLTIMTIIPHEMVVNSEHEYQPFTEIGAFTMKQKIEKN